MDNNQQNDLNNTSPAGMPDPSVPTDTGNLAETPLDVSNTDSISANPVQEVQTGATNLGPNAVSMPWEGGSPGMNAVNENVENQDISQPVDPAPMPAPNTSESTQEFTDYSVDQNSGVQEVPQEDMTQSSPAGSLELANISAGSQMSTGQISDSDLMQNSSSQNIDATSDLIPAPTSNGGGSNPFDSVTNIFKNVNVKNIFSKKNLVWLVGGAVLFLGGLIFLFAVVLGGDEPYTPPESLAVNNCCEEWGNCSTEEQWINGWNTCQQGGCSICAGGGDYQGCNNNGVCDAGESEADCPSDCTTGGGDTIDETPDTGDDTGTDADTGNDSTNLNSGEIGACWGSGDLTAERQCLVNGNSGEYHSGACLGLTITECINLGISQGYTIQSCGGDQVTSGGQMGEFVSCTQSTSSGSTGGCGQVDLLDSSGAVVGFIIDKSNCTETPPSNPPEDPPVTPSEEYATCVALDNSQSGDGARVFEVIAGEDFSTTLYTDASAPSGVSISSYTYGVATNGGSVDPSGSTSETSVEWTLLGTQTADMELGMHDGAYVQITDSNGGNSGGMGTNCSVQYYLTSQSIDWALEKVGEVSCGDDDPSATVDYVITVVNLMDSDGSMTEITDSLDSKVDEDMVSDISNGGVYDPDANTITWRNIDFESSQSIELTYSITVDEADFGEYTNIVSATPATGEAPEDAEFTVAVDCELPETALGDGDFTSYFLFIMGGMLVTVAIMEAGFGVFSKMGSRLNTLEASKKEKSKKKFEDSF